MTSTAAVARPQHDTGTAATLYERYPGPHATCSRARPRRAGPRTRLDPDAALDALVGRSPTAPLAGTPTPDDLLRPPSEGRAGA
ncbi:hypothetical protein C8E97_2678 [Saccharothrix australiensis]|uniref:Uncharacterized protein n=1 Tax=Saccharothrix australiensis TaxID=2072 RepID=A0A495W2L6_9PSEU|nr:hypothetical protein C8E97_2678 [Saccharothrix australiensis]